MRDRRSLLIPIWLLAVLVLGEQLHGFHLLGGLLIAGGILLATWPKPP